MASFSRCPTPRSYGTRSPLQDIKRAGRNPPNRVFFGLARMVGVQNHKRTICKTESTFVVLDTHHMRHTKKLDLGGFRPARLRDIRIS
jgi:hypothetical protein